MKVENRVVTQHPAVAFSDKHYHEQNKIQMQKLLTRNILKENAQNSVTVTERSEEKIGASTSKSVREESQNVNQEFVLILLISN